MRDIAEIDKNFKVETEIDRPNLHFYDAEMNPFRIYGLLRENDRFCRMPGAVAKEASEGVHTLHTNTAGGRVRFVTNSAYVAISAEMDGVSRGPHMPLTGGAGFDLYADTGEGQIFMHTYKPPYEMKDGYEGVCDFWDDRERLITINFPLYADVKKLYIGLEKMAYIKPAPDYTCEKPIVYYGSSITQGACASRPGNAYQAILSRTLDANFINLGFSGNALAEECMADYISSLDMSVFVLDYDHNSPSPEHLQETHERMYRKVREKHPSVPIVMLTRPKVHLVYDEPRRVEVVKANYEKAVAEGDKNVYFIKGSDLLEERVIECATVDGGHPNDSGFLSMANVLYDVLKPLIGV